MVSLAFLDCIGRINALIISAAGMTCALVVNAAISQHRDSKNLGQTTCYGCHEYVFSFFFTITEIISWVYPAEIFPISLRALRKAFSIFHKLVAESSIVQISQTT